jgi:tetraprenyl-beta-curcumene synthase
VWALARAARRELLWGLPAVSREVAAWRRRARAIPDASLREDALAAIASKRGHADGAALFWTLPRRRHPRLLALLVAYQAAWDFLDNASERGASRGERNGRRLHAALVEGLDPDGPLSDHYRHHLCAGDGGYLRLLAETCRVACAALPSYAHVRVRVLAEAERCAIQSINHHPDPAGRDSALKQWAERERSAAPAPTECASVEGASVEGASVEGAPAEGGLSWFELTAAASASLVPHVLLALAAEPRCEPSDIVAAHGAYLPWASLATAMLDSYADRLEDAAAGEHSYIAHYRDGREDEGGEVDGGEVDGGEAIVRLAEIVARATSEAQGLRAGHRHAVIVACMVAMYLSKDSARSQAAHRDTDDLVRSGGSLVRLLLPVLRVWRIAYGQRAA